VALKDFDVFEWAENFQVGSALDRLVAAIFVGSSNLGAQLMAIFTAYFDAGGHPSDQPFVVVSGYVANSLQWQVLNGNWLETHRRFDVPIPFHATDFMHGTKPYDKWEKGGKEANAFLTSLCLAQQLSMLVSISCIVDMGDFRGMNEVLQLDTILPAFALGARFCVELLEIWQRNHEIDCPIECIFEDGDFGRGKFIDLMRVEHMPPPIFKDKKDFPGLQAADHLAWEQGNQLKRERKAGESLPFNESFSRLLSIPHIHRMTTLATLLDIAEKKGVPIRRGKIIKP
jgi:hypothetical protein